MENNMTNVDFLYDPVTAIDEKKATEIIRNIDKERFNFHKKNFSKDLTLANHYNLCLNVKGLSLPSTVDIIAYGYSKILE